MQSESNLQEFFAPKKGWVCHAAPAMGLSLHCIAKDTMENTKQINWVPVLAAIKDYQDKVKALRGKIAKEDDRLEAVLLSSFGTGEAGRLLFVSEAKANGLGDKLTLSLVRLAWPIEEALPDVGDYSEWRSKIDAKVNAAPADQQKLFRRAIMKALFGKK